MADARPATDADSGTDGGHSTSASSSAISEPTLPGTALPETSRPETSVTTAPPASHLSIGEVLALLLDEFPDVTISKIRFLESQGLIEPERTPSGYRKFYDADVELLRCILREQKDNFLPLKVIKDRLDTGEIDPTSEQPRPRGLDHVSGLADPTGSLDRPIGRAADPRAVPGDPSASLARPGGGPGSAAAEFFAADPTPPGGSERGDDSGAITLSPGIVLSRSELCSMAGLDSDQLEQLTSYGVVIASPTGDFDEDALEVARIARRFLDLGVDARHLRGWRVAADREAGLFEQLIQPMVRQRNPEAQELAAAQLTELEMFGGQLRSAMMRTLLRRHLDV